jgi:hypothetical protein
MDGIQVELQGYLKEGDNIATGNLYKSIKYEMKENIIELSFNKYGIYVDTGTGTRSEPFSIIAIVNWIQVKGLSLNPWAVWKNIMLHGTKAHPWVSRLDILAKFNENRKSIYGAMKVDITEMLSSKFKNK